MPVRDPYDKPNERMRTKVVEMVFDKIPKPSRLGNERASGLSHIDWRALLIRTQKLERELINFLCSEVYQDSKNSPHRIQEDQAGTIDSWKSSIHAQLAESYIRLYIPDVDENFRKFENSISAWAQENTPKPKPKIVAIG